MAFSAADFNADDFDVGISGPTLVGVLTCTMPGVVSVEVEPVPVGTVTCTVPGVVSVIDPAVFAPTGGGRLRWSASASIGAVAARLLGKVRIDAGEDSARVATFEVIPLTAADISAYDSAPVTIDLTLYLEAATATMRVFTGRVERVRFEPVSRKVTLDCRDGWQERPAACQSAAEVEALFAGLAAPCARVVEWSTAEPDPVSYFEGLLPTLMGATMIDASGGWQVIRWEIGSPAATFGPGDIFDGSLTVTRPARVDVPSAIVARLVHRYPRLHGHDQALYWEALPRVRVVVDGIPLAPKSMISQALEKLSPWLIKGEPLMISPASGTFMVIVGGQSVPYILPPSVAQVCCNELHATMHRRWYQEVEVVYSVTIETGGLSERDDSISARIESSFDSGAWETAPSSSPGLGIWTANGPEVVEVPTGYEGLSAPHPPANGALDHWADVTSDDLAAAGRHVAAKAVRRAAAGKRQQRVTFERPADPRWEIGSVLTVNAYGVTATGQCVDWSLDLDHDSGAAISTLTLACPDGAPGSTGFTATMTPPANTVSHTTSMLLLGNHVGGAFDTPAWPPVSSLVGFLCNVLPTSDNYSAAAPLYEGQFRIIMPEIDAVHRDPLEVELPLDVSASFAGGSLEIDL